MKLPIDPQNKAGKSRIIVLIMTLLVLGLGWAVAQSHSAEEELRPSIRVLSASASPVQLEEGLLIPRMAIGRVEARRRSALGFERDGLLREVLLEEGQRVQAGQVLARLDADRLQAQAKQLDAALAESVAILELRKSSFARQEQLRRQDIVSEQLYDEARQGLAQAEAARDRIAAERERVSIERKKSELRAPYEGRISRRFGDEGDVFSSGTALFELLEESDWEIRAGLSPQQAANLEPGDRVQLQRSGQHPLLQAEVLRILPRLDDRTRTVDVILQTQERDLQLREGELLELLLEEQLAEAAFSLPVASLQEGSRGTWVLYVAKALESPVPGQDGLLGTHRIEARPVHLLGMAGESVYVQGLLEEGEAVLQEGLHKFTPGQIVRLLPRGDEL